MRHGLPGFLFYTFAIILLIRQVSLAPLTGEDIRAMRAGYLISLGGIIMACVTVSIWANIFVFFMVMLGAGVWLIDWTQAKSEGATEHKTKASQSARPDLRYTRFPPDRNGSMRDIPMHARRAGTAISRGRPRT